MKYLEVKKDDLVFNINTLKRHVAPAKIIAVLKGNAYGLGMIEFASVLSENGIDTFAVSELSEALTLREAGFSNEIILLTPTNSIDAAKIIIDNSITATVGSFESARVLNSIGLPCNAHIKIDTGFSRYGFYPDEISDKLCEYGNINFTGMFSHFSDSFGKSDKYSKLQFERFKYAVSRAKSAGIKPEVCHICNSCGAVRFSFAHLDAVRIGSAFLGRLPIENTLGLKRLAVLKSEVLEVRTVRRKEYVGYANTVRVKKDTPCAIIGVGYKDGYGVEKSNDTFRFTDILRYIYSAAKSYRKKIYVKINGRKYPIIGRISMHNIVVDVSSGSVSAGDMCELEINPILLKSEIKRNYI